MSDWQHLFKVCLQNIRALKRVIYLSVTTVISSYVCSSNTDTCWERSDSWLHSGTGGGFTCTWSQEDNVHLLTANSKASGRGSYSTEMLILYTMFTFSQTNGIVNSCKLWWDGMGWGCGKWQAQDFSLNTNSISILPLLTASLGLETT